MLNNAVDSYIVDRANSCVFVATAVEHRIVIGGLVFHSNDEQLAALRNHFQETPVEMPAC